jgi:hypothetical protein
MGEAGDYLGRPARASRGAPAHWKRLTMRADVAAAAADIEQSIELLRRRL